MMSYVLCTTHETDKKERWELDRGVRWRGDKGYRGHPLDSQTSQLSFSATPQQKPFPFNIPAVENKHLTNYFLIPSLCPSNIPRRLCLFFWGGGIKRGRLKVSSPLGLYSLLVVF